MRKVKTASGATAVQIAESVHGQRRIVEHIGSAHTEGELAALIAVARGKLDAGQEGLDLGLEPEEQARADGNAVVRRHSSERASVVRAYPRSTDVEVAGVGVGTRKCPPNWQDTTYLRNVAPEKKGISQIQLSHTHPVASATFDDPNLVSSAGLVPVMALADEAGLRELADERLTVPGDKGANPGLKLSSMVAGMVAGADSIDDMALLRHGGMGKLFSCGYAPSTLGSFLRSLTFGHVRQVDAVASRFLLGLGENTPMFGGPGDTGTVMIDLDDTVIEVHGYAKQGAAFGYSGIRGLNAVLATVSTEQIAPVIAAQRLRKGNVGSPRGAARLATDALALVRRSRLAGRSVLVRADSAFYSHTLVRAARTAGAAVSITMRMIPNVKRAIASIDESAWTPIKYTDAIYDEATGTWTSRAEVAEIPFTAFTSKGPSGQVPGRLVVRRIPDLNPGKNAGQDTLFNTWRFHAFFTTTDSNHTDTVAAD